MDIFGDDLYSCLDPHNFTEPQSTCMLMTPVHDGFCNARTMLRGKESDAKSLPIARVLGHMKSLFLITISDACSNVRSELPRAFTVKVSPPARITIRTFESDRRRAVFIESGNPRQPHCAPTPIIQSPEGVRSVSHVISIVLRCNERMFVCP